MMKLEKWEIPELKTKIERKCNNCQDAIVCFGLDEWPDDNRAKECPDWHPDFMLVQDLLEKETKQIP